MKHYQLIAILVLFTACNPGLYYPLSEVPKDAAFIELDSSFTLYTRLVYKEADTTAKIVTNEARTLKDVIEIDYLLLSEKYAVYITTIPDPVQLYYSDNPPSPDTLDIQRFSRFQFGSCDRNEIEFIDKRSRSKNTWIIDSTPDTVMITRIIQMKSKSRQSDEFSYENEISIDFTLENKIEFMEQPSFHIVLAYDGKQENGLPLLADKRIYYTYSGLNARIYFKLDKPYKHDTDKTVVSYRKQRIHFPPIETTPKR